MSKFFRIRIDSFLDGAIALGSKQSELCPSVKMAGKHEPININFTFSFQRHLEVFWDSLSVLVSSQFWSFSNFSLYVYTDV